ncbi:hypothetical protein 3 [Hubei sobemo-like virus 38]|uniref:hypothetical protein 3 n=1 Tax=Hubei sobemo-like virus 38 TaxID=1923225 RepID=UPI00090CB23C|nr:hypothetical protein 3 [Hubei sobemo-like virus 38]APG75794.1 hypothetical protein 3 [Hubei sobemo-like virus 38]
MDASPGLPFCKHYKTNAELLGFDGFNCDAVKADCLVNMFYYWLDNIQVYPFRIFIKDEPHKLSKKQKGRWRLIFSSPLFYQILEHLLLDPLDEMESLCQWDLPTKLRWHPFWGGAQMGVSNFDNPVSLDKQCWDWTLTGQFAELDNALRSNLVKAPNKWHELFETVNDLIYNKAVFQFSSGHQFQQVEPGLMKSGLVRTLSTNSHCQCFIHWLAEQKCGHSHKFWTIGDDLLVDDPCDDYLRYTSDYCILKEVEPGYNFAGFNLKTKTPLYWSKHIYRLLYVDEKVIPDVLDNYQRLYVYSDKKFNIFQDMLYDLDPTKIRSQAYLKRWAVQKPSNFKFLIN